ncbi:PaaI family thioesterase [Tellurirhabdus bombi]|uniref:PaaI family thioesterase n=1 Tax=Tellurirhabdus bombi TaxID=2907205 RepID=UPI001F3294F1|nr:PaaI family thioesterase [Tellurirhabdus bombi]
MNSPEINSRLQFFQSMIGQDMRQSISPLGRWLNGVLRVAEQGSLTADYVVREEMCNPMQVLHGGTVSAMLDDLIGATVYSLGREYAYTSINLSVDFLHAARLGETVTATARIVRAGKNVIHAEGVLVAEDGKLVAKASSNLVQTSLKLPF